MQQLVLGARIATQKMHIVDHQHVERPDPALERRDPLGIHRIDVVLAEIIRTEVEDRAVPAQPQRQRLHQMGLAEADAAEQVERTGRAHIAVRDAEAEAVSKRVRLTGDEVLEGEEGLERRGEVVEASIAGRRRALRRRGGRALQQRLHHEADFGQGRVGLEPEHADALAIAALHPVAHEARRKLDRDALRPLVHQGHRFQPALENPVPVFGLELAADPHPFDLAVGFRARHAGYSCFQGRPAAFQPQARPRWPSPSRSPSNPSETL